MTDFNPYAPPVESSNLPSSDASSISPNDAGVAAPSYKLYSSGSVALASFFGSFLGGCAVLALNYRRLGRPAAAWKALLLGALGSGLLIVIALVGSDQQPIRFVLAFLPVVTMTQIVKYRLGETIAEHQSRGGKLASGWTAFGIGMGALGATVALIAGISIVIWNSSLGRKLEVGPNQTVYYGKGGTAEDARKVGRLLAQRNMIGDSQFGARVTKSEKGFEIWIIFQDGYWDKPEVVAAVHEWGESISPRDLPRPFTIHLCDETFVRKRSMTVY